MTRKTISFTKPNDNWVKEQLEKEEYSSNSELVNDLIRKARKNEERERFIRAKLERAEKSGLSDLSPEEIRKKVKSEIKSNE